MSALRDLFQSISAQDHYATSNKKDSRIVAQDGFMFVIQDVQSFQAVVMSMQKWSSLSMDEETAA